MLLMCSISLLYNRPVICHTASSKLVCCVLVCMIEEDVRPVGEYIHGLVLELGTALNQNSVQEEIKTR